MLDAFGEVFELSLALQSESTTLTKAYELVKHCIRTLAQFKEGHIGKDTKAADVPLVPSRCSLPFTASLAIRELLDEIDVVDPSK